MCLGFALAHIVQESVHITLLDVMHQLVHSCRSVSGLQPPRRTLDMNLSFTSEFSS